MAQPPALLARASLSVALLARAAAGAQVVEVPHLAPPVGSGAAGVPAPAAAPLSTSLQPAPGLAGLAAPGLAPAPSAVGRAGLAPAVPAAAAAAGAPAAAVVAAPQLAAVVAPAFAMAASPASPAASAPPAPGKDRGPAGAGHGSRRQLDRIAARGADLAAPRRGGLDASVSGSREVFEGAGPPAAPAAPEAPVAPAQAPAASAQAQPTSVQAPPASGRPAGGLERGIRRPARASRGPSRRGWRLDGAAADWVGGGGFKDVLAHPDDGEVLLQLFTGAGTVAPGGSRRERDRDARRLAPLASLGLAPRPLGQGALELDAPSGSRVVVYSLVERVRGRTLETRGAADLPLVRALFERLIAARIRLEDEAHLAENLMIGRTASSPKVQAWVVDAGEAEPVAERSWWDRLAGRPDPLRAHYDRLLRKLFPAGRR